MLMSTIERAPHLHAADEFSLCEVALKYCFTLDKDVFLKEEKMLQSSLPKPESRELLRIYDRTI